MRFSLSSPAFDVAEFRSGRAHVHLVPYELLAGPGTDSIEKLREKAERLIHEGWSRRDYPPVPLSPPIPWDETEKESRSWSFYLHCWDPLNLLLAAFDTISEPKFLRAALDIALDWTRRFSTEDTTSTFAWYDMAVGLRAHRLAYLIDAASRSEEAADDEIAPLVGSLVLHAQVLGDDERFAGHSNHGFYQAAGQLAMARRFPELDEMHAAGEQALERLNRMVHQQFTEEGVHREHSPDYHRMVLDTLDALLLSGLIDDDDLWARRETIEAALAWFVLPNGTLAMFGDTDHRSMLGRLPKSQEKRAPEFLFVSSQGSEGKPPKESYRAFQESGYFVARDRWPTSPHDFDDRSYLAQAAAFHSRTHKHADDLTFIWYDLGHELVVDAGRYGYLEKTAPESELAQQGFWYGDPRRMYIESTRAHNTVMIDGKDHQRRGRKPFGSALMRSGSSSSVVFVESHVRHNSTIRHARVLFFLPRHWVVVFDWLHDNVDQSHALTQWFHFGETLDVSTAGRDKLLLSIGDSDRTLTVAPLLQGTRMGDPIRGQVEPEIQGWWSPRERVLRPNWAVAYEAQDVRTFTFATLLSLGDDVQADPEFTTADNWGRRGLLGWRDRSGRHTLRFERREGEPLICHFETS